MLAILLSLLLFVTIIIVTMTVNDFDLANVIATYSTYTARF